MTDANNGHDPTLARWNEGHNSAMEMMKPQIAELDKRLEELKIEFDEFARAMSKQLATARNEALEEADAAMAELRIVDAGNDWAFAQNKAIADSRECVCALKADTT